MVLQDLDLAAIYGDRVVVLVGGRVLADGWPGEVLADPAVRQSLGALPVVLPRIPCVTTAVLQ